MKWIGTYLVLSVLAAATARALVTPRSSHSPDACPGYKASNFHQTPTTFTADLTLAGKPCNVYGTDLAHLKLEVDHETGKLHSHFHETTRLHVKIWDAAGDVYQVPESVFPRPASSGHTRRSTDDSELQFSYVASPFSFAVHRKSNGEVLFNTSGSPLIFESQYLRLRTSLPMDPNLYGLGENSDHFRLNTTNYTRTLWSHDAYGIPPGNNLYGNHPVYYDHRGDKGTSGTFLLNSDGMDIKINTTDSGQYLEYNIIGGIFDFYFVSGPSPVEVAQQYSEISGKSAMMPYWGHGFHQCRYGYQDYYAVAEVIYNYSVAKIPLETMWTDIDYMDLRKVFSNDPQRFPSKAVRDYVKYLHDHDQHYIVMVDPAVAYQNYPPFNRGVQDNIFLKEANGTIHKGVVWPGVTAFPDWFSNNVQGYWNNEFLQFFNEETGFDIDAVWIDMNEPSNFPCPYPCDHPEATAEEVGFPPKPPPLRVPPRPLPGFPSEFQPPTSKSKREAIANVDGTVTEREYFELPQLTRSMSKRAAPGSAMGLPGRDLINPKYTIQNAAGSISNLTVDTDIVHENGYVEYDTHNLYGTMMSTITADAMQNRRPGLRPMVITRSTFAGAGKKVGHWLGDNNSIWDNYRGSIQGMLDFAALFQVPMVGSDVCGYGDNTTETLCARWAMLGAFQPFYRNHNNLGSIAQEFYQWPTVAQAAKNAIGMRYQLLDYFYTAMHQQSVAGTPALNPLVFLYPNDANTFAIDLQFFFGNAVLVSPVTQENVTTVDIYLPDDQFYDLWTYKPVRGHGAHLTLNNVGYETIPLHVRGGTIIPMRSKGAMTTTALRKVPFNLIVAIGLDGTAAGTLYLDDGVSISQPATSQIAFAFKKNTLTVSGSFGYTKEAFSISSVTFLGLQNTPHKVAVDGHGAHGSQGSSGAFVVSVNAPLTHGFTVSLS